MIGEATTAGGRQVLGSGVMHAHYSCNMLYIGVGASSRSWDKGNM